MSKIVINWKLGVTKIKNMVLGNIKALDQKGFLLVAGRIALCIKYYV